ncbi:MAG: GGDEF domain-containing protein [Lachnospiraceae bacterium]|nr:GGDEF domain-containing protein [Lachnospiraceae bacterium]
MKQSRGKKKNDRTIVGILLLGLLVLTICLAICLVHIAEIKTIFEQVKTEESYQKVTNAEDVLSDHVNGTRELLAHAAFLMTADEKTLNDEDIFEIVQQYGQMEEFDNLYYVSDKAQIYHTNGTTNQRRMVDIAHLLYMDEATCFAYFEPIGDEKVGIAYYVAPVCVDGKKVGQLVGATTMEHMLERSALDNLKELGDIFLISSGGLIYARSADEYVTDDEDLFGYLRASSADKYSDNRVLAAKDAMRQEKYQKTYIVDHAGMTDYMEIAAVEGMGDVYFAYLYPETVVSDIVNPVVKNSLITCVMIIAVTLWMLFYMWATSKRASDTIELLAYGDPITGGKNDNYFRNVAADVIWQNTSVPYLVARFDVANFRYINEAYGHVRADELLTIIIEESGKIFKDKEICSRMDSDQFVLLARNDQSFEAKFEEMMMVINDRAKEIGIMFPIRLKRGICPIRVEDNDIGIIIDHANAARKSLVGDEKVLVATYSDKIVQQMYIEEKIESEMAEAMRNGEFKVFIQPKWDLFNDCIYGGEALVRWIRADGSMVFPDQFIPVFEKNGFVEKLDLYMLEEVCKKLRRLIDENKEIFPISVNQSRILLHNPDYINQVAKILKRYRIPNGFVELEITETVFFDERNLMISTMNQLKSMDVSISMDDFGSGYSSLNMLKDVQFDVLKIDREFFSEVITSEASILILRKIVEMAEGLGIRVLCEGVETVEQVEILKNLGCYYAQGYYYSKPISSEEFIEKYCDEKAGGKEYYDALYTGEVAERAIRDLKKNEETNTLSAHSSVEKFKQSYVSKSSEEKSKTITDADGKILSVEEQKIRAREARNVKQTELSKDSGSDTE